MKRKLLDCTLIGLIAGANPCADAQDVETRDATDQVTDALDGVVGGFGGGVRR